jgi:ADP-ribose pyrophosphatase
MDRDAQQVEIIAREIVYRGFFQLERYTLRHSLYAGGMSGVLVRELLERGHAAAVLPYDPVRDEVILIEQFRIGALELPEGAWVREIVAGIIEPGETAEEVVLREAREEAGCEIERLEFISRYLVSPGGSSEQISLYCGKVDSRHGAACSASRPSTRTSAPRPCPARRPWTCCSQGGIPSATPIIALQWLAANRERCGGMGAGPEGGDRRFSPVPPPGTTAVPPGGRGCAGCGCIPARPGCGSRPRRPAPARYRRARIRW